jgi:hypothetical protein
MAKTYRETLNVVNGVKAQIEACLNALDLHEELPDEVEDLGTTLANAFKLCETIIEKAASEPEPDEATPPLNPDDKPVEQPAVQA